MFEVHVHAKLETISVLDKLDIDISSTVASEANLKGAVLIKNLDKQIKKRLWFNM